MKLPEGPWLAFGELRVSAVVWEVVIDPQVGERGVLRPVPWRLAKLWQRFWQVQRGFGVSGNDRLPSGTTHFQLSLPCKVGRRWCRHELVAETEGGITYLLLREETSPPTSAM